MKVKELITKKFPSFESETPFKKVVEEFNEHKLNYKLIVNSQNEIIGIVTTSDLFNASFPDYNELCEHREYIFDLKTINERNKNLYDQPIKNIMTRNPECVDSNKPIPEAAVLMKSFKVKQLLVVENNEFIGVLTIQELISKFILEKIKEISKTN
ncbi:MAG: CBS domain-containing protein [Ignavibacterium sp.]|uniref:CBS domain-containing protein n=1 Tax=Ignavibacterium sp. TaxID=2651167 RepID=UPI004049F590